MRNSSLRPEYRKSMRDLDSGGPLFAALDLGTNNCRLLIAEADPHGGFVVAGSFSRIVRLGEDLAQTGQLSQAAMMRALAALAVCAERIAAFPSVIGTYIATEACRRAENGAAFLTGVREQTGLALSIVTPAEEAALAAAACADLVDGQANLALVVDIGGGSTELSLITRPSGGGPRDHRLLASRSFQLGVVALAESFGQSAFEDMRRHALGLLSEWAEGLALAPHFSRNEAHIIGTSGTMTSLAGVHLGLARYRRDAVDGLWLSASETRRAGDRLCAMNTGARAQLPSIGVARADLIVAGYAIFAAILDLWPASRLRVADRGLREGLLLSLIRRHASTAAAS